MYYNGNNALTYNCLFNFIVGNRGAGKTYWSKNWAIKDFLKTGKQFIYVRRYDTEFNHKNNFWLDIMGSFPEHKFEVKGNTLYINDEVCGQFMALSKAKIEKSNAFPEVNKIIFDEFILDKGCYHYLADEVTSFLDLYETIARTREGVRVFFLSNAITVTNPYFLYFKIVVDSKKKFKKINNDILIELVQDEDFIKMKKKTRFGKLIEGTAYSNYAVENKFLRDTDTFLEKKTGKSRHYFTLKYNDDNYGVWVDYSVGKYFISKDIDTSCRLIYSVTLADHSPNTMLLKGGQSAILKNFLTNYKLGNVYYESINIKNVIYEIVRMSLL